MLINGRVVKSTGSWYLVKTSDNSVVECRLKGIFRTHGIKNTNPVVVGDIVKIEMEAGQASGIIAEIEPRSNYIIRKATNASKTIHILASNINQAVLVATLHQPRTSLGFIDRFLVTAEAYGIPSIIVFNKSDIYDSEDLDILQQFTKIYKSCGYQVMIVSAFTGDGMEKLKQQMRNKVNLLTGHSGVGKSAIINYLHPGLKITTGEISEYHQKGKHTTTFAQMHEMEPEFYIVDTPGIKEFGLIDFKKEEVALYFPEMRELLHKCQYYNCTHSHEPGCEVKKAVTDGRIATSRYGNYLNIIADENLELKEWD